VINPYLAVVGVDPKKLDAKKIKARQRLLTAEEMLEEAEVLAARVHRRMQESRILLVLDSVPALLTSAAAVAGITGQSRYTDNALAAFLSRLLRRWVAFAQTHNILMVFINQLRESPGTMFGDPTYTPGGNALRFYCHSRVRLWRVKGGRITKGGRMIGIKGTLTNIKNKLGGVEREQCGFKIYFSGKSLYLPTSEVKE
jgi:RecA/RadA recombinase